MIARYCLAGLLMLGMSLARAEEPEVFADDGTPLYEVNFVDTELGEFINSVSRITGTTFIVDPRVQGKVTVRTVDRHDADAIYDIFLAQLRAQGFAAVDLPNGSVKIVPDQAARLEPVPVESAGKKSEGSDGVATRVFNVRNAASEQMLGILKPLIDPRVGVITPYPAANLLVVTDWRSNLERIDSLLRQLDQVSDEPLQVIPLKHASAADTAGLVTRLLAREQGGDAAQVVADPRSNALLVRGSADSRERVRALLAQLDRPGDNLRSSNTQVMYLRHANAAEVVKVLRGLSQAGAVPAAEGEGKDAAPVPAASDSGIRLEYEEGTNAVVMVGPDSELAAFRSIVEQLDIRRAQVVVEAIIAEVSDSSAQELGVQWLFADEKFGAGIVNFGGNGVNIASIAGAASSGDNEKLGKLLSATTGATAGIGHIGGGFNFAMLVNALKGKSGFNLLSTPTLLTLDNAEASILVGQEVPFVTGSVTQNNANPYQTIERKEVGVKLRIKPQVNVDNSVRLDIVQEVSSIADSSAASDVITNKREIKTKVMVEDNGLVILGGLISDELSTSNQRVPLLGDIPYLGRLFRSDASKNTKQNLMVFIRPRILRDGESLAGLSQQKYQSLQQNTPLKLPALAEGLPLLQVFPSSRARLEGGDW
ncbi:MULTISPECIES: type II secretion system secretin GspD [unclassified Pseudomonas]|uniref:type II secretion system secretin GspD n=1 Tax=unclassified Pseudomonas TaxID=196821 RepID=UPI001940A180|nr:MULTISPECIES: type II secretion system secretin GspD [unclassified Pseudomonas]MDC0690154.1 type II secretion system secretin GspD [Mitsuaria sp. RG]MCE0915362.1 type II secretion system secretin GspD [Pseudomonas sp. NMI760_13]MCF1489153.1 type II secretion system secretin GspD [Pseudomonas sp. AA27]MCP8636211.1 type II secretion system secretin GspD [Pseudomonas sp. DVZ6]MDD7786759.1 type II secretion system secretin GspD [Pseudomonas sp. DVZ24]